MNDPGGAAGVSGAAVPVAKRSAGTYGRAVHGDIETARSSEMPGRGGETESLGDVAVMQRCEAAAVSGEAITQGGWPAAFLGESVAQDGEPAEQDVETVLADVVIVGAGAAGLTAALGCVPLRVVVLTKARLSAAGGGGASAWAQGGVASAVGDDDNPALHAADTLAVGGGLNDAAIVRLLTGEGPERVRALLALGAEFDRDAGGHLELGREAAHSRRRILHAHGDATGAEVVRTLVEAVRREPAIHIVDEVFAIDLARDGAAVTGVRARRRDGRGVLYRAPAVVLATGGLGQLYLYTTNPREATADGLAMAARAGARLVDLEFVQFHPTALATGSASDAGSPGGAARPAGAAGFSATEGASHIAEEAGTEGVAMPAGAVGLASKMDVAPTVEAANAGSVASPAAAVATAPGEPLPLLTEALRGEGAELVDDRGVRFMADVHPDRELAPRDVVARAIWRHLRSGRRVFLDARRAVGGSFPERFPTVFALCRAHGLDPRVEPMPVVPAAHYHMGGVAVDASGRTSLPGLWACGEVAATGAHGANRLASNSLLEALVFGARVAECVVADAAALAATEAVPAAFHDGPRQGASPAAPSGQTVDTPPPVPAAAPGRGGGAARHGGDIDSMHAALAASPGNAAAARAMIEEVRHLMWECVGVERDAAGLALAAGRLDELLGEDVARRAGQPGPAAGQRPSAWRPAPAADTSSFTAWEARNLLWAGRLLAQAALARRESRGGHYRSDHPHADSAWQRRLFLTAGEDGTARFERQEAPAAEGWSEPAADAEQRPEPAAESANPTVDGGRLEAPQRWAVPAERAGRRVAQVAR